MKALRKLILTAGLLTLGLGLTGCAWGPHSDDSASRVFPYVRLSPSAPPQAPYEAALLSEDPLHQVWRKGYWDFDGTTFFWVSGYFIDRPSPTAVWTPDRWEQRTFGWAFIPGYWQ